MQAIHQIDIREYPVTEDRGILSDEQLEVFHKILRAVDNHTDTIKHNGLTKEERCEIVEHIGLYYGSMEGVYELVAWGEETATLDLDLFIKFSDEKKIIDARVDEAVSSLYEGSDRFKLWQISNYISKRIEYTDGVRDTLDGLNGQGVCATYSMLFYKMATRLGIQTYKCYGYADGAYHSWNMVELDGERFYYDITYYDNIVHDLRYLHSKTTWRRDVRINSRQ
jgi:hypothetical protein